MAELMKQYARGLARNGVPASQRQDQQLLGLVHLGALLLVPRVVAIHAVLTSLRSKYLADGEKAAFLVSVADLKLHLLR